MASTMEQPRWLATAWARAWPARGRRRRRQRAHPRLLPRRRPSREPARRGGLVRGVRRRVPRTRGHRLDALADGALVPALGRGRWTRAASAPSRCLSRGSDPAAGHVGFLRRRDRRARRAARRQPGRCGERRRVSEDAAARLPLAAGATGARSRSPRCPVAHATIRCSRAPSRTSSKWRAATATIRTIPAARPTAASRSTVFADWKGVRLDAGIARSAARPSCGASRTRPCATSTSRATGRRRTAPSSPAALAFFHFDAAVNHGVTGAMRLLQQRRRHRRRRRDRPRHARRHRRALRRRRACSATPRCAARAIARCTHFWRFGRGWLARVDTTLGARRRDQLRGTTRTTSHDEQKGPTDHDGNKPGHAAERQVVGTIDHHLGRHHHRRCRRCCRRSARRSASTSPAISCAKPGERNCADGAGGRRSRRHDHDDLRTRARHQAARATQHATEAVSARAFMTSSGGAT